MQYRNPVREEKRGNYRTYREKEIFASKAGESPPHFNRSPERTAYVPAPVDFQRGGEKEEGISSPASKATGKGGSLLLGLRERNVEVHPCMFQTKKEALTA